MEKILQRNRILHIVTIDVALVALALLLPIAIHAIGASFRFIEPMRLMLLATILFIPVRKNAYCMALILPWISFAIVGMPLWWKAALMALEYCINAVILYRLLDLKMNVFLSVLISILMSKMLYYAMKFFFIQTTLLPQMPVVENVPALFFSAVLLAFLAVVVE